MPPSAAIQTNWYDHPEYYDLAFRSDSDREAEFIEAACRKFCPHRVRTLLEPACGTGRLVVEMAARGFRVTGLDLSEPALAYLRKRLARRGLKARALRADMADFQLARPADAAYCTLNSFRHLLTEEDARRHLACVARHLRPGGIYILGFHLLPPDADLESTERWTERHGRVRLSVTLRVTESDRRRRIERLRVNLLVRTGQKELRLRDEFPLRLYTAAQFRRLLRSVPEFELCEVFDFWYEIDEPVKFDDWLSDAVFILRRR